MKEPTETYLSEMLWSERFRKCRRANLPGGEAVPGELAVGLTRLISNLRLEATPEAEKNNLRIWQYFKKENERLLGTVWVTAALPFLDELSKSGKGANILELGCGPGGLLMLATIRWCQRHGGQYWGLEISPLIRLATQAWLKANNASEYAQKILQGDASSLSCLDKGEIRLLEGKFDLIVYGRIGNHLVNDSDWQRSQYRMEQALEEDGMILVFETLIGRVKGRKMNANRPVSYGSKFRTLREYLAAHPRMEIVFLKTVTCYGDNFAIFGLRWKQGDWE